MRCGNHGPGYSANFHLDYAYVCAFVCATVIYRLLPGVSPARGGWTAPSKPFKLYLLIQLF